MVKELTLRTWAKNNNLLFVLEFFGSTNSKAWKIKEAFYTHNDALFAKRQIESPLSDTANKAKYRITPYTPYIPKKEGS